MRNPALTLAGALLLAGSCTLDTDYFSEYRGENLITSYDFGAAGAWTVPTAAVNYTTWAQASDLNGLGLDVGPDGSSPAFRLEIKNLIPNGDFEVETNASTVFSSAFWTQVGTSVDFKLSQLVSSQTLVLDHRSAFWTSGSTALVLKLSGGGTGAIDLANTAYGITWGAATYQLHIDMVNATSLTAIPIALDATPALAAGSADNDGVWNTSLVALASGWSKVKLSKRMTLPASEPTATVSIGSTSQAHVLLLDNVRLVRTDVDSSAVLTLASLKSTALKLLPGSGSEAYTFSVYVRADPTADQDDTVNHVLNRMEPSGVTLSIRAAVKSGSGTYQLFFPRTAAWDTGWVLLSASMGFDFVDSDSELVGNTTTNGNALIISLSPTNRVDGSTGYEDAGSLLLSQPDFQYNP